MLLAATLILIRSMEKQTIPLLPARSSAKVRASALQHLANGGQPARRYWAPEASAGCPAARTPGLRP